MAVQRELQVGHVLVGGQKIVGHANGLPLDWIAGEDVVGFVQFIHEVRRDVIWINRAAQGGGVGAHLDFVVGSPPVIRAGPVKKLRGGGGVVLVIRERPLHRGGGGVV